MEKHVGKADFHPKTWRVDKLIKTNSDNGKAKESSRAKNEESLSVWSQHTGTLLYFQKPPLLLAHFPIELAKKFLAAGFDEKYEIEDIGSIRRQKNDGRD